MNHWLIVPVALPALTAPFILMAARFDRLLQRTLSIAATTLLVVVAAGLYGLALDGVPRPYRLGDWAPPFGIVLVLDQLSALMVLLASLLGLIVLLYAVRRWDKKGPHFHALFQFQLMGLNGAFLTGDLFNLFVFFEVMLIASYGLLLHGATARRIDAGLRYIAVNLVASTLFLIAAGLIYAVTGTLNMADIARKLAEVPPADLALLHTGGLLLLLVFAIKAAVVPLHLWLPGTYAAAPAPVGALFAIMTKVGGYAILRVTTLIFTGHHEVASTWLLPAALVTMTLGMLGVLAARTMTEVAAFAVLGSMGTLLIALGLGDEAGTAAALYYLPHSTLSTAALFLLADLIAIRRGGVQDRFVPGPRFRNGELLAGLFFLAAIALVGMPPLSGFIGKLLILESTRSHAAWGWIWALVLATSLVAMVGFARAGSMVFWKTGDAGEAPPAVARTMLPLAALTTLVLGTALLAAFGGPVTEAMRATARQLHDPAAYIDAVLGPPLAAAMP